MSKEPKDPKIIIKYPNHVTSYYVQPYVAVHV